MKFITKIELFLVSIWLGAACFFSFGVAPSAFIALPSTDLAGNVVNRTLTIINFAGIVIAVILMLTSLIPRNDARPIWIWVQRFFVLVVGAGCGAGQLIIGFYLEYLRSLIEGPVSKLAADDPRKIQFDMWHQYSVWILFTAMGAALIAFFVISRSPASARKASTGDIPAFDLPDELKM